MAKPGGRFSEASEESAGQRASLTEAGSHTRTALRGCGWCRCGCPCHPAQHFVRHARPLFYYLGDSHAATSASLQAEQELAPCHGES